ncbi:MAG: hypothetical protein AAF821_07730 [Cyanobacteria bacterium P01_D01_bin.156]
MRNLANAARLTAQNPTLPQLRLLQALEQFQETIHLELAQNVQSQGEANSAESAEQ